MADTPTQADRNAETVPSHGFEAVSRQGPGAMLGHEFGVALGPGSTAEVPSVGGPGSVVRPVSTAVAASAGRAT